MSTFNFVQIQSFTQNKTKSNLGPKMPYLGICTSNYMFKREIWDKFTEFTFSKF